MSNIWNKRFADFTVRDMVVSNLVAYAGTMVVIMAVGKYFEHKEERELRKA